MSDLTQPWATLIASAAVLLSAVIAASVAWYNRKQADRHFDDKHELERTEALRGRYTTAAEQLAHESAAIRLAGAYAIVALADDWHRNDNDDERQVCVDLLRAYLRTPMGRFYSDEQGAPELEVRKTIILSINKRRTLSEPSFKSWKLVDCSFARADLSDIDLSNENLSGANLNHASLANANLTGADFTGADLSGAVFVRANMFRARLEGADLEYADLGNARLDLANLSNARVESTNLNQASVEGANLTGVDLARCHTSGLRHDQATKGLKGKR
ncbi:pentapeptide repeat-containing protein [Rhodococcus sp. 7Tela_A2]|uniref:pentapeptide repeat-containing protein n=1 Tax=Rhodococcus sp. 7Tela_A2 TaxID=3093744 RepID=UPI003BB65A4A